MQAKLSNFFKQYEKAANSRVFTNVAPFISDDAVFWFTNGIYRGKTAIQRAFEETWAKIENEAYSISNVQWLVSDNEIGVCTYDFTSDGLVGGERQVYSGRGTNVLLKKNGRWQIIHEHLSKSPLS